VAAVRVCVACPDDYFQCQRSVLCVPRWWICDGVNNCLDWSDELNCSQYSLNHRALVDLGFFRGEGG